mgnify:CR=1 FL=1
MKAPSRKARITLLVIAGLLLFSAAGKWLVFRIFLGDADSGRQRIESAQDSSADRSGS